ncbi:hypothetical protein NLG97_g4556 [Lecanicillium saksenae]|uniref:Uncharacterized protein n=1 Tax=Lecanicillium saksenae TaxID=468837 RepID=A0ACC1QWA1_9HYPO|nr:hypothetical protein NLG97_g4556 [Lecanicillium saksenae]
MDDSRSVKRTLSNQEILKNIIERLPKPSQAHAARVNRQWFDTATQCFWATRNPEDLATLDADRQQLYASKIVIMELSTEEPPPSRKLAKGLPLPEQARPFGVSKIRDVGGGPFTRPLKPYPFLRANVVTLQLSGINWNSDDFKAASISAHTLREIEFINVGWNSPGDGIIDFLTNCTSLARARLEGDMGEFSSHGITQVLVLARLRRLELLKSKIHISKRALAEVIKAVPEPFPSLRRFSAQTQIVAVPLIFDLAPNLPELEVSINDIQVPDLRGISKLTSLRLLRWGHSGSLVYFTKKDLLPLTSLRNLQTLSFDSASFLDRANWIGYDANLSDADFAEIIRLRDVLVIAPPVRTVLNSDDSRPLADGFKLTNDDATEAEEKKNTDGVWCLSSVKGEVQRWQSMHKSLKKACNFTERPKDPYQEKLDILNDEVSQLKRQLQNQGESITERSHYELNQQPEAIDRVAIGERSAGSMVSRLADASSHTCHVDEGASRYSTSSIQYDSRSPEVRDVIRRGRRSHFATETRWMPDFVSVGIITLEQAEGYFTTFFEGCDHYVPVFDPSFDTFQSVRHRSTLLFAAICTVGCRVACGTDSHQWRLLNFHLKRMLSSIVSNPTEPLLETIQALLVRACYSAERSLLVATATRMAIDFGLPDAYDELVDLITTTNRPETAIHMRKARTWLHVLVLGHILHVDAGDMLTIKFAGDPRRARVLLDCPSATILDRFLFAQVELNVLRASILSSLSDKTYTDEQDTLGLVRDSKIDIELWHTDWERILQQMADVPQWIVVNLRVQKCWATTMALCRAVRTAGIENVDFMSPAQRSILSLAKESLRLHLQTIIVEPRSYLQNLKYAMDFVWAKCAFCYLLLLKLCILLPEENGTLNEDLVACGAILSKELSTAGGAGLGSNSNSTAKMYLQLLQTGTEKFTRALQGNYEAPEAGTHSAHHAEDESPKERNDLDSFVPEQFVFEWDFPGLSLFSSSATGLGWLDDILLGALNGGGDFFGLMASNIEGEDPTGP